MGKYDSGRASEFGGINLKQRRGDSLNGIRFNENRTVEPSSSSDFILYRFGNALKIWDGSSATTLGAAGGLVNFSLNDAYDDGRTVTVDAGPVLLNGTNAAGNGVLEITADGGSTAPAIKIGNSGSGNDITGTAGWSITKAGVATFDEVILLDDDPITLGSASDATIQWDNTNGYLAIAGAVYFANAVTFSSSTALTLTGTADTDVITVTAGDVVLSNGKLNITNDDTDAVLTLTANSVTTGNAILLTANGVTSGAAISIVTTDAGFSGNYILISDGSTVFSIGDEGATTIAGAGGSDVFTITAGDAVLSDGSITITDADNAATFSLTNNTATTASVVVIAGSGTFTGSTTSSFMTITPSGLTSGTALYMPAAALTTGKGIHVVANALTTGEMLHLEHTTSVIADGGSMLRISSTSVDTGGATNGTLLDISSTSQVAGSIVKVVGGAMTTGVLLDLSTTTGMTTGSVLRATTSTAGAIATNGAFSFTGTGDFTVGAVGVGMFHVAANTTTAGTVASISGTALTTGVVLYLGSTGTGMTSGSIIRATTGTTGAIATNGVYSFLGTGNFTVGADTLGMFHVAAASTAAGTIASVLGGALTTGIALHVTDPGTGMTSGSLLRIATATTGAVATNGIVSIRATGAYTSTSNAGLVDVLASATTAGTVMRIRSTAAAQTATELLRVVASGFTTGYTGNVAYFESSSTTGASNVVAIVSANTTAGNALSITANSLTTGTGLLVTSSGTITSSGEGLVNIVGSGITTGSALKIDLTEGTLNGGWYINCYDDTASASVFRVGEDGAVLFSDFTETVTAANVITADESGSVFFLASATEFASTLPAARAGLHFTFIVTAAPSGANYTITTNGSSNIIKGTAHSSAGADEDSETSGCDTINFVDGQAVAGDMVILWCDGTNWFAKAFCDVTGAITFTTAS